MKATDHDKYTTQELDSSRNDAVHYFYNLCFQYGLLKIDRKIKKVIFNNPATIVLWKDGTKTVVKCFSDDVYDKEKGFCMAVLKYIYGNDNSFHKLFKKWVPDDADEWS